MQRAQRRGAAVERQRVPEQTLADFRKELVGGCTIGILDKVDAGAEGADGFRKSQEPFGGHGREEPPFFLGGSGFQAAAFPRDDAGGGFGNLMQIQA